MNLWGISFSLLLIGTSAFADRSISIAVPKGEIELVNPSSGNVVYSVECYDKANGANLTSSYTTTTLQSKKSVRIQGAGVCSSGAPAKVLTQGPFFCSGSVPYASAASLCGPSSSLCTLAQLNTAAVAPTDFLSGYWIKPHASVTTWSSTYDSWTTPNAQDTAGKSPYAPQTNSKGGSSYACAENSSQTNAVTNCSSGYAPGTGSGSLCCPANNGFASCKVTIHTSGTVAGGHLQSPQFKGGAAF